MKIKSSVTLSASAIEEVLIACGVNWKRGNMTWTATPKIIGMKRGGITPVDMADQQGVYFLFARNELIHVGDTGPKGLGTILLEHTRDNLQSKWDFFSFLGLREVRPDGTLGKMLKTGSWSRCQAFLYAQLVFAHPGIKYSKFQLRKAGLARYKQVCSI